MIVGQAKARGILARFETIERGSFGVFGPEHVGKRLIAQDFARRLLAHEVSLPLEAHPDFALYDAEREEGVDALKTWLERLHQTSARGGRRIFMLDHAESLNMQGFNALLNDLEEPGAGVIFLVIASREEVLPATVRSRLVPVRFGLVSLVEMQELCRAKNVSERWATEACGRPGLLMRRIEDPAWWDMLDHASRELVEAMHTRKIGKLVACLDRFQKEADATNAPAQAWRILLLLAQQRFLEMNTFESKDAHGLVLAWRWLEGAIPPRIGLEWSVLHAMEPHTRMPRMLRDLK